MNEARDFIHSDYGQYVLINTEKGSVVWYENYGQAVRDQATYGGTIFNTHTTDPELLKLTIDNARWQYLTPRQPFSAVPQTPPTDA